MKNNLFQKLASGLLFAAAWASTAAWAVNDLPGGPGVRQLNLQAGATKIAQEQGWLQIRQWLKAFVLPQVQDHPPPPHEVENVNIPQGIFFVTL